MSVRYELMDGGLGEKYDEIVVGGVAGVVVAQAGWIARETIERGLRRRTR